MLENLVQTVPEARAVRLRQELALLHRSAERFFAEPEAKPFHPPDEPSLPVTYRRQEG